MGAGEGTRMNVPMILTFGRLVLAPVYFLLYRLAGRGSAWLVAGIWLVFILIEVSDLLDGHFARKLGLESEEGKVLDPLADSLSRLTYFISFTGSGIMPVWVLLVLVYRDVGVSYIRVLFSRGSILLPARLSGKVKAWVYAFAGGAGTAVFTLQTLGILSGFHEILADIAFVLFIAAAGVALWSLGDYGLALLNAGFDEKKKRKGG
jgi:CDP-diacylglycerol--glycerol-3-phosphate 3-phosphatidyltransferase